MKRRTFLKLLGGFGAVTVTGLSIGCSNEEDVTTDAPGDFPEPSKFGGIKPEAKIDLATGEVDVNKDILMRHSACLGCYSSCGNRVKIDKATGRVLKVEGNPYNPNNA